MDDIKSTPLPDQKIGCTVHCCRFNEIPGNVCKLECVTIQPCGFGNDCTDSFCGNFERA